MIPVRQVTCPSQVDISQHRLVLQPIETQEHYKFGDTRKQRKHYAEFIKCEKYFCMNYT
jgi:hypothetical protein